MSKQQVADKVHKDRRKKALYAESSFRKGNKKVKIISFRKENSF